MKCHIPQISWHNRDPVLSVDFQTTKTGNRRIATAGTDTHVLIWALTISAGNSGVNLDCVADLSRHSKTVNVVRFSPNGEILASADDEAAIILWKQQTRIDDDIFADADGEFNKENWTPLKILRGHIDDICDLSWSADSQFLVTGSVDNTAIMWDVIKGKNLGLLSEHKGFVQGVAWDPLGQYIATLCSDRSLRIYNINTKKVLHRVQKAVLPNVTNKPTQENPSKGTRIFYDDTLKSFCRRLTFSPDGSLLIVPTGIIEENEGKFSNATYVFSRATLNKPALYLPTLDKFTLAVRCCPVLFQLRDTSKSNQKSGLTDTESSNHVSLFSLPHRIVFAVATQDSILFYDSQQVLPFAKVSNIHYTRLSDLSWSPDGRILLASSTDGYCSFVIFSEGELGIPYVPEEKQDSKTEKKKDVPRPAEGPSATEEPSGMDWTLVLEPTADEEIVKESSKPITEQPVSDSAVSKLTGQLETAQLQEQDGCNKTATERMDAISDDGKSDITNSLGKEDPTKPEIKNTSKAETDKTSDKDKSKNQPACKSKSKDEKTPRRIQLITLSSTVNK